MIRRQGLPELLAPAGDMQALYAAVMAGADAVYVGGKHFGARAFAKNFGDEELRAATRYCHLHGVRIYVTVNTLVYDKEVYELAEYAAFLWQIGVDAAIVADLGAIDIIRKAAPRLELHASTQMGVHSTPGAELAAKLGCSRVVLARELSYKDISEISREASVETEVFLHGALCVCHSGQCLFSSLVGGRSGNRGECAQPCRLPYNGGYPLSLRDLSLAAHITELIESGTASLKIEGRMKSPDYVYGVVSIYRRLLDERRNANAVEHEALSRIFSRQGFTDGYFTGRMQSAMTGVRSGEDKSATKEVSGRSFDPIKRAVKAKARFIIGEPAMMEIYDGERTVSALGDTVVRAISAPLTEEGLCQRLSKMGNTFLSLSPLDIEITLDKGANLSPGAVNALRRAAAEAFESCGEHKAEKYAITAPRGETNTRKRTALFLSEDSILDLDKEELEYFDIGFAPLFAKDKAFDLVNGVYIPPVLKNSDIKRATERLEHLKKRGVLYTLVGNLGAVELSRQAGLVPIADMRMNVTNAYTKLALEGLGIEGIILSAELDIPKARDIGGGVTVYGRIPLMLTERCFIKENFSCKACSSAALKDRMGKSFPIIREHGHRNLILNSQITYMADEIDRVRTCGLSEHFIFSVESAAQIRAVIGAFREKSPIEAVFPGERARRIGIRESARKKQ